MNLSEEELQKNIEAGLNSTEDDLDLKSYGEVFRVLKKEPDYTLQNNFSDKIIAKVVAKQKRDSSRDFFWLGTGIFFLVIAFIVAVVLTGFKVNLGFLKAMSGYTGLFIFSVAFILVLNWLDKRLVHRGTNEF